MCFCMFIFGAQLFKQALGDVIRSILLKRSSWFSVHDIILTVETHTL